MKKLIILWFLVLIHPAVIGQALKYDKAELSDSVSLAISMQNLANDYLKHSKTGEPEIEANDRFMIELLAGDYEASIKTIQSLRNNVVMNNGHPGYIPYELFSKAKIKQLKSEVTFKEAYRSVFKSYLANCNDEQAYSATIVFTTYDAVSQFTNSFETHYKNISGTSLPFDEALVLLKSYFLYHVFTLTEPMIFEEIKRDENKRYLIKEEVIVSARDGAEISVITARKRDAAPMPAVLEFTIYADASNVNDALLAASKGYAGVVATSRGKRLSKDTIAPYKYEYKDVYAVIDWISKQVWNNAKVGMYGGSYNGFTQWASMKEKVHPALKTIVPSVSAAPGIDVPMENNVFFNFPYKWIPYVTNTKFLDNAANFDRDRWDSLEQAWFESGKPYFQMDSIDGTPSPVFQEWISHPSYDAYWQNMIPYKEEFSHIDIPILTTTGYYDDGQRGAMYYYLEHVKYNPKADHYLVLGPYDHWGAQFASSAHLRGYPIDKVAYLNIKQGLVFDWFDYILKGKEKPALLKNKVNFQVMGTNTWMHAASLSDMNNDSLVFYLSPDQNKGCYTLDTEKPKRVVALQLDVDFKDRTTMNNMDYYPSSIIEDSLNLQDGLVFMSEPFKNETIINGSFKGDLKIESNKKDFDFGVNLFELTPEGRYFHLSYYIGRASYAKSREQRNLLKPHRSTTITFDNTRIISKKLSKNSRIVIVINGNKNSYGQINYGTGRDVSKESIDDATIPLQLKISTESRIILPIWIDNQR
jgi:putative CocE/NonD family hydrolase